ncbi:MAG: hypothetical protein NZ455_01105 [Bacteroidia bacterium]|nr:hypothetical protein [Bacteroidia bacterium]MDW8346471.1 hypothetical protein [Bacteroidia bacterium]
MRRVRQQCVAQRSTEAIAQPAARRPEAQRRDTPKKIETQYLKITSCKQKMDLL